jgi:hypothetical protein
LISASCGWRRGYLGKLANLRKTPVKTDSNARFLRRPRIILILAIFAVLGTVQASFTIGINSQLDDIVLTDGRVLVNARARILPSSARTEAAK